MRSTRANVSRVLLLCGLSCAVAACGKKEEPAPAAPQNEAASTALEGQVDIVAWPGYIERGESDKNYDWVTKFEADTGCKVNVKTAGTSDEMLSLMNQGAILQQQTRGRADLRELGPQTCAAAADLLEAAYIVQICALIATARRFDVNQMRAGRREPARALRGACHAFQPEVAPRATPRIGNTRDFTQVPDELLLFRQ